MRVPARLPAEGGGACGDAGSAGVLPPKSPKSSSLSSAAGPAGAPRSAPEAAAPAPRPTASASAGCQSRCRLRRVPGRSQPPSQGAGRLIGCRERCCRGQGCPCHRLGSSAGSAAVEARASLEPVSDAGARADSVAAADDCAARGKGLGRLPPHLSRATSTACSWGGACPWPPLPCGADSASAAASRLPAPATCSCCEPSAAASAAAAANTKSCADAS